MFFSRKPPCSKYNCKYHSRLARLTKWIIGCAMVLTSAVTGSAYAQELIPLPQDDPFHQPPAGYGSLPNGTILRDRKINAQYLLPFLSTEVTTWLGSNAEKFAPSFEQLRNLKIDAYQVLYKSIDGHNQPSAQVATILVPQGSFGGAGTRPLVSYQIAIDSTSTRSLPSYTLRSGLLGQGVASVATFEVSLSLPALAAGYAVVYPDFIGPKANWIDGPLAGHLVLDGIRAATRYAPAGLAPRTRVGMMGYSGGGQGTGWAAQLKDSYAPELNIVGAVLGANPSADLVAMYTTNNGQPVSSALLVTAIAGLNRAYPEAGVWNYLNLAGKALIASAEDESIIEAIAKRPVLPPLEVFSKQPWVPLQLSAPGKKIFEINTQKGKRGSRSIPILSVHDEFDELVPVSADNDLMLQYCREGISVQVTRTATPTPVIGLVHIIGEIINALPALNYLTQRFEGKPSRNDCAASNIWASPLPLPYKPFQTE